MDKATPRITWKLLATSNSKEKLEKLIKEYFFGSEYKADDSGLLQSKKSGEFLEGFKWDYEDRKFRFYVEQ